LTQHYLACLSHASYLIGDETSGRAGVADPRRDVGVYQEEAAERGLRTERVIETHLHADFLSGHLELAGCRPAAGQLVEGGLVVIDDRALVVGERDHCEHPLQVRPWFSCGRRRGEPGPVGTSGDAAGKRWPLECAERVRHDRMPVPGSHATGPTAAGPPVLWGGITAITASIRAITSFPAKASLPIPRAWGP
jgi:hypothetical protein